MQKLTTNARHGAAKIIVDSAADYSPSDTEDGGPWGRASFHTVGAPSLASVTHALRQYGHGASAITYSTTAGTGAIADDFMLLVAGQEIEIPAPQLEVQSILVEQYGRTSITFKFLGDVVEADIDLFMNAMPAVDDSYHHYDMNTAGEVTAVFMSQPDKSFEIGQLYKL